MRGVGGGCGRRAAPPRPLPREEESPQSYECRCCIGFPRIVRAHLVLFGDGGQKEGLSVTLDGNVAARQKSEVEKVEGRRGVGRKTRVPMEGPGQTFFEPQRERGEDHVGKINRRSGRASQCVKGTPLSKQGPRRGTTHNAHNAHTSTHHPRTNRSGERTRGSL